MITPDMTPLGYGQLTGLGLSKDIEPPVGANAVLFQASGAGVRWRDDGQVPTATTGYPLLGGDEFWYTCAAGLKNLKFIEMAPSAAVDMLFYGI